ncbi:hypothetical protein ABH944_004238 [Caballeronia udeis]|uniref:Uncharacterized protein n=1 Tax=Caballeronia udeis TaxID=1232866 RepID=A0ABW8ML24_9BURK
MGLNWTSNRRASSGFAKRAAESLQITVNRGGD